MLFPAALLVELALVCKSILFLTGFESLKQFCGI